MTCAARALAALLALAATAAAQVATCGSCTLWLDGKPGVNAELSVRGACAVDCAGSLHLRNMGIVRIANGTLAGMPALRTLYLDNNSIAEVHPETFRYNTALRYLTLYSNGIAEVHPETFRNNTALRYLRLDRNSISGLHPETFRYNTKLQELHLFSNRIAQVNPKTFQNKTALHTLDIFDNPLGCVPGVPEDVVLDKWSSSFDFDETPRCDTNCTTITYYNASAGVCLPCPSGHRNWGVGAVECSPIKTTPLMADSTTTAVVQVSSTSSCSAPGSTTLTTPAASTPPPAVMACDGDARVFSAGGTSLCVPSGLYPAANVSHCVFNQTWEDVTKLRMETGGLGALMVAFEWEVWVCGAQLPCAMETSDLVCFTYNEVHHVFVPWGYNRQLDLVN